VDGVAKAMNLLNGGMFMSKSELVVGYPLCVLVVGSNSVDE
jgi:hypothetical protein